MTFQPLYQKLSYWVAQYGAADAPDQRAVHDFIECETSEAVRSLQSELIQVVQGNFKVETMDQLLGMKRRVLHGSYDAWAKLMLQWIAGYKH